MLFDDAPAPKIGTGVAQRPEQAIEPNGFVGALGQLEFDRIDLNGARIIEILSAVDELPERVVARVLAQHELAAVTADVSLGRVM
ncbi:hypothetical protein BJ122_12612 [Rhodopseudomonas faecalis]|uniref:Uncharacterized protein n=2 Tax=Rhodopseudomonas faecalis TaxID=99655 RepID=A0A318T8Y4_9BRAD|nr:hypothetical protein BJ122_12612 [Rhodopseudomonas faecalis]